MTDIGKAIHERLAQHVFSLEQTIFHAGPHSLLFPVEKVKREEQQVRGAIAFAHSLLADLDIERDATLFARARSAVDAAREF